MTRQLKKRAKKDQEIYKKGKGQDGQTQILKEHLSQSSVAAQLSKNS